MNGDGATGKPGRVPQSATCEGAAARDGPGDTMSIGALAGRPIKRSFSIAGHRTSISLEAAFWDAFRDLCHDDGIAMAAMLARIDRERGSASGLSSAVRIWVLQRYRAQKVTSSATTSKGDEM